MANVKHEINLLERLEARAPTKAQAKRIYNLTKNVDVLHMSITELLSIPGMGRKNVALLVEIIADYMGKS